MLKLDMSLINCHTMVNLQYRFRLLIIMLLIFLAAGCKNTPKTTQPDEPIDQITLSPAVDLPIEENIQTPSVKEPDLYDITRGDITCTIDLSTGLLKKAATDDTSLTFEGLYIDIGYNGEYPFQQLGYITFENANTWELPMIWPRKKNLPEGILIDMTETDQGFIITMAYHSLTVAYEYEVSGHTLILNAKITTTKQEPQLINGVAFLLKGIDDYKKYTSTFEFPGSTPGGIKSFSDYGRYAVTASDYSSPLLQLKNDSRFQNILFINEHEKWTTGAFTDDNDRACTVFLSATEASLSKDEELIVGTFYLPLTPMEDDPYLSVQEFYTKLGYHVPIDSVNDGPVYSCHPYGTMDTNYFNRLTLTEYAEQLDTISSMGFKNIWLLPIFYHTGDNVYEPIDQGVIDNRYGGLEGARTFINKAHGLNLRVLFDLVPHGPRPVYAFAKEHDDWVSKDREGNNQIEWECVSFDYNHPDYYNYTSDLLSYYATELGLDGARIDCAMGGLSNWSPIEGLRASSSGLMAGVNITKAVKEGFLKGGVTPILLPENFHPIPYYAMYTDLFYDMPLYRMMHSLNHMDISETEYVKRLSQWLDAERKTSVKGQVKLRFLGNHDTVTWTFDAKRPQEVYGTKKAKALWSILSFIDGVPFIYQGDEDPATYNLHGENLTEFFTGMLAARSDYLPSEYDITYMDTGTPVFAFTRHSKDGGDVKLILVNLSDQSNVFEIPMEIGEILYEQGSYEMNDGKIVLEPYAVVIIQGIDAKN